MFDNFYIPDILYIVLTGIILHVFVCTFMDLMR